jgi:RimJ/RimL family protein N-acetyltransferase
MTQNNINIYKADLSERDLIVYELSSMSAELKEFSFDPEIFKKSVELSFQDHVKWFLFKDKDMNICGTCYLQSVHNYWRLEKRFYLGGFYIRPSHRGQGNFKKLYAQLKEWASKSDGAQIYAHIHKDNDKSINAFQSVGMEITDYKLLADHWGT